MSEIDIEPNSSRWSTMKTWSTVGMAAPAVALVAGCLASAHYTGQVPTTPAFWLLVGAGGVAAIANIGAHIRDSLAANQERILLQLDTRLSRLEVDVSQYGDRREVSGQMVAAHVVNGRPHGGRRPHLMPVDE